MLEDRVRLHWALRTFLWFVTVPPNKVAEKQAQYRHPPEPGSIVVKEAAEEWETKTPLLHAADARHDLTAVRRIIDAGAGIPPHWRGEPENATLATAEAMQAPAERHLKQRQRELVYFIQELLLTAYRRQPNYAPLPTMNMQELFAVVLPDITRTDNLELAQATQAMAGALATLVETDFSGKPAVAETMLRHILTVLGQPPSAGQMAELLAGSSRDSSSAASGG
jgi:hypothetical protein